MTKYLTSKTSLYILMGYLFQGYPWILFGTGLTLWLKDQGVSRTEIALLTTIGVTYALNLVWAPLIDIIKMRLFKSDPYKSWIILLQSGIALLTVAMAFTAGGTWIAAMALCAFSIALLGATSDVAVDAWRVAITTKDEQQITAGAAMATCGWWLGYGLLGGLFLTLLGTDDVDYRSSLLAMATVHMSLIAGYWWLVPSLNDANQSTKPTAETIGSNDLATSIKSNIGKYLAPMSDFFRVHGLKIALMLLTVILFFKVGEAMLGRMSLLFYKEIGFSNSDIAIGSKLTGALTICVASIIGCYLRLAGNIVYALVIAGILMAATNLLFAWLATQGPVLEYLIYINLLDQVTTAVSSVFFVAFLTSLCNPRYAAFQYAALASIGNLTRTTLSGGSGWIVDQLGGDWALFFAGTACAVVPTLLLLLYYRKEIMQAAERIKKINQPSPSSAA